MSAASKKGGQRLWALFTDTPRLSASQAARCRAEGKRMAMPPREQETPQPTRTWVLGNPSPQHCAFAQKGHDYLTVYFIFLNMTREDVAKLREAMAKGESTADWPWPMTHAPKLIQRLNWNDRQEAWRLFGEGGLP